MKTTQAPKDSSKHHSSKPFFNKRGEDSFFSSKQESEEPFFSPSAIQPKLTIGQPNDKYEQEADEMAERVSRMPMEGTIHTKCADCEREEDPAAIQTRLIIQRSELEEEGRLQPKHLLQKQEAESSPDEEEQLQAKPLMLKTAGSGGVATPALTQSLNSSKGGGQCLPDSTNRFMSQAFGHDFSRVRVHTNNSAVQMNQGLNARAFTHGSDVYFNRGQYSPDSSDGKRLLAHELAHVVQQGKGINRINCQKSEKGKKLLWHYRMKPITRKQIQLTGQYQALINLGASESEALKACRAMHKDISSKDVFKWWSKRIKITAYLFHVRRKNTPLPLHLLPPKLYLIWHVSQKKMEYFPPTLIRATSHYHHFVKRHKASDQEALFACDLMKVDINAGKKLKTVRYYLVKARSWIKSSNFNRKVKPKNRKAQLISGPKYSRKIIYATKERGRDKDGYPAIDFSGGAFKMSAVFKHDPGAGIYAGLGEVHQYVLASHKSMKYKKDWVTVGTFVEDRTDSGARYGHRKRPYRRCDKYSYYMSQKGYRNCLSGSIFRGKDTPYFYGSPHDIEKISGYYVFELRAVDTLNKKTLGTTRLVLCFRNCRNMHKYLK